MFLPKRFAAAAALFSIFLTYPALAQNIGASSDAAGAQKVLIMAARDIHEIRSNPHFASLLERAKGVFVVPELVEGSLGFGASGGTGVFVAHEDGHWSNPAFLTFGSFSFGLQFGWTTGPLFMFPMTDKALAYFTQSSQLSFYGNAAATFATWSVDARFPIGGGSDVVVWSGQNGGFAGLVVAGADIHDKTVYEKAYYNNKYTKAKQVIGSEGDPNARPLLSELPS